MEGYSPENNGAESSPKYKGVRKRKWGKWVSEIRLPNSRDRIWLGSFDSPEKAARAFDAALFCLRGPGASFNFPENPPEIPGGRLLSPGEIQVVASRFANEGTVPPLRDLRRDGSNSSRGENQERDLSSGGGGREQEGNTTMDWSFLTMLDNDVGPSEFGYLPGLDNDVSCGSDLLYHQTRQPSGFYDDDDGGGGAGGGGGGGAETFGEDDFSQHYSLWNF